MCSAELWKSKQYPTFRPDSQTFGSWVLSPVREKDPCITKPTPGIVAIPNTHYGLDFRGVGIETLILLVLLVPAFLLRGRKKQLRHAKVIRRILFTLAVLFILVVLVVTARRLGWLAWLGY